MKANGIAHLHGNGKEKRNGNGFHGHAHDLGHAHRQAHALETEALEPGRDEARDLAAYIAMGDDHVGSAIDTPLRADAFALNDEQKMAIIERHFEEIMLTMGLDLSDDSLSGTPHRVAKMFVKEIFYGLDPAKKPAAKVFENKFKYGEMLVEKNVSLHTTCEHHFLPIVGRAHVAYISSGTVIGLSKINRIVDYYARRPQVQERLTVQIVDELKRALETEDVAVIIDAKHFCVAARGIQDTHSSTVTAEYSGRFKEEHMRKELLSYLNLPSAV